jgi:hypothetical protein
MAAAADLGRPQQVMYDAWDQAPRIIGCRSVGLTSTSGNGRMNFPRAPEDGVAPSIGLPTTNCGVDVERIKLEAVSTSANTLGGQDRGAGANKRVEDDIAAPRAIAHRIGDERDRFHRGMDGKIVKTPSTESVDARISPDVSGISLWRQSMHT